MAIALAGAKAQSDHSLIGKWQSLYEVEGEKIRVDYQFKNEREKLGCYAVLFKDDAGNEEAANTVVMSSIDFENQRGKAQYLLQYEGETYEVEATLRLINAQTLEVHYSYYGYADTETWKRQK
ncbi:MAG: hypothetical protein AAFW73_08120 [Bacteroidota bacterium]